MKVINLYAGPGVGKSTVAAGLFYEMKKARKSVELVTEYAKDLTWEQRYNVLSDQVYIFAKQQRRVDRLKNHNIDYVITDGPAPQGLVYHSGKHYKELSALVCAVYNENDNINILLTRHFRYDPVGRYQTETEALELDRVVKQNLIDNKLEFVELQPQEAIEKIMDML